MDKKISQLTAAAPLTGTEVLPVVQSGQTVKTTIDDILNAESITYAQATALMGSGGLTPGKSYLLSDFQTVHYIVDVNGNQYLDTIITGATEPLVLKAASTTTFDPVASSTTFPQDIIRVDLNANNWLNDLSFADIYGTGNIVPGFKGVITYREDTKNMNKFYFDFRNCKFRRWKVSSADWNSATAYSAGNKVYYNFAFYYATKANTNQAPGGSENWIPYIDADYSKYLSWAPSFVNNVDTDPLDFVDVKMFVENGTSGTYELSVFNNVFGSPIIDKEEYYEKTGTYLPNNVIYLSDNDYYTLLNNNITGFFFGNTISNADYFIDNDISLDFSYNIISGYYWYENSISGPFETNLVGRNVYGNNIRGKFYANLFGNSVYNNLIGPDFSSNKVNGSFNNNSIGPSFNNNNVYCISQFRNNFTAPSLNSCQFQYSVSGCTFNASVSSITTSTTQTFINNTVSTSLINFSTATHVYQSYHCQVVANSNNDKVLYYVNGSNVLTVVAATA
jgi:hypothetical protein